MRRATQVLRAAESSTSSVAGTVTLAFDDRHRRRIRMVDDSGEPFLLDLPDAAILMDGDRLVLEDGGHILVRAADEDVADVYSPDPNNMTRIAWHIGNRHVPIQVMDDGQLRIRDDHVLVAMLEGLGGIVTRHTGPFSPEPGAYAGGDHSHGHGHDQ